MSRLIARHPDLGDLVLHSDPQGPSGQPFMFQALAGADYGDPEPVTQAIDDLLGSMLQVSRWQNRQVSLIVTCAAPDGEALAEGERALGAYLADRFELVWEPVAEFAQPVSFWIEPGSRWPRVSEPQGLEWDLAEALQSRRSWQLTLSARPFVLAAAPTVTTWTPSGAQGAHTCTVGGVAPASAGLSIAATGGLGKVVAHVASTPLAYSPAMRQRATSTGTTLSRPSVPAFAGTDWMPYSGRVFSIPAATLPDGPFEILAHAHSTTAQTIALPWTAQTKVGGVAVGPVWSGTSDPIAFTTTVDQLVPLGKIALPIIASDDPAATLEITFGTAANIYVDEGFLLWVPDDKAALITGDLGSGAAAIGSAYSRLEVQSPTVTEPRQRLKVGIGSTATVGGSHVAGADRIIVQPGPVQVYVATAGTTGATVSLSVWEAFHDHTLGAAS